MTDEARLDTPTADMADFVAKYGAEGALDGLHDKTEASPSSESPAQESNHAEEDDGELDAATLQALGLTPEDAPSPAGDSDEEGTAQPEIDLASLANTLGLDQKDLTLDGGQIKVRTKVDGDESLTPLSKLREGYQLREHFTRQNEAFLQQKREWEQATAQEQQRIEHLANAAGQVLQADEENLKQQYTRDWQQLRQDDPAEYAAQVAEYNSKLQDIRSRRQQVFQDIQQRQVQAQQAQVQQVQQVQEQGRRKLAEELGWSDQETFTSGAQKLREYLSNKVGLTEQEIAGTTDYRSLVVTEKARKYDELMGKVDLARKKVNGSHKVPTGAAPKTATGKKRKVQESIQRLKKDHSVESAAEVFKNLGIV